MAKEKKKVPNLRFKGFTDDWEQQKFSELYIKSNKKNDLSYKKNKVISVATMSWSCAPQKSKDNYMKTYNVVHKGDIVFEGHKSDNFQFGRFVENTIGDGIVSHIYDVYSPTKKRNLLFWKYYINSEKVMRNILRMSTTSARMMHNLVSKDIANQILNVPSHSEQLKIGKIISLVQSTISLQQRKLDLLKQLKKGLLQKMFADKDSKRPVLRFEGFNDDWERWKLGDLVVIKSGLSTNTQSRQGFYKITRIETISKGLIDMNKTGSVQIKPDDKYLMHAGDILFSNINSLKHIGKVAIFNGKSTLYHGMNLLRMTAQSNVSSYFIYYQLITDKHSNWAKAHANPAVSQASINQHTLSLEPMYITKLEEQHEISDFIGKLDSILTFQQQKLVRINKIKKSLLQQIFI